ncbi:MAG: DNA-processing protein DprA [Alphaproteobacteria bacterium]
MEYSVSEKIDIIRLIRSENVGPITYRKLVKKYGSAKEALAQLPELAKKGGKRNYRLCSMENAAKEYEAAAALGASILCVGEADYPKLLSNIEDAPPVLYALGHAALLNSPLLAMVGARNASINGCFMAKKLAQGLASVDDASAYQPLSIVSGLARGIDTAAHEGALLAAEQQGGSTVAVMAGGIDAIYPSNQKALYERIKALGVIVSEHPPGLEPQASHFPRRNRIVSGLSLGVLVVEAAPKSGSLITARLAGEQGREVFAIPGSPMDSRSRGTNELIRQGATLVERLEDIQFALANQSNSLFDYHEQDQDGFASSSNMMMENMAETQFNQSEYDRLVEIILDRVDSSPTDLNILMREIDATSGMINAIIIELELGGKLQRHPGNRISRLFDAF